MKFLIKSFDELTASEVYDVLQLRSEVFVVEQSCVYQDVDGKDNKGYHILGYFEDRLVAYTRFFGPGNYLRNSSFGRVVVKQEYRKFGFGKMIVKETIDAIEKLFGKENIEISAQTYLKEFYKEFGFHQEGEEYLEDAIPHIKMVYN